MDKILASDAATYPWSASTLPTARALPASKTQRKHLLRYDMFTLTISVENIEQ